jgi:hypothetical protein
MNDHEKIWQSIENMVAAQIETLVEEDRYEEAEATITAALHSRENSSFLLDLLARIHAQQGHWKQAEDAWGKALKLDPANRSFEAGLRRLSQVHRLRIYPRSVFLILTCFAIILGCSLVGRFLFVSLHPNEKVTIINTFTPSPIAIPSKTPTLLPPPTAQPTQTPTLAPPVSPTRVISPALSLPKCRVITGITNGSLNVRSGPDINFPAIGWIPEGEVVDIIGDPTIQKTTGWVFIYYQDLRGWINAFYCK